MKRMIAVLLLISATGVGCVSNRVFAHALQAPKWPVAISRTIGVVAVIDNKRGRNVHLTRDLTDLVTDMLKHSAYYTHTEKGELLVADFEIGKAGERLPTAETIADLFQSHKVDLLLLLEVLDSKMWVDLGSRVGYGIGFGRAFDHGAFGASLGTGTTYWNANGRLLLSISLADAKKRALTARTVEGHSFHHTYTDFPPSESHVFEKLLQRACTRTLTYVDVYFHPSPRYLQSDGTKPVTDAIRYAKAGGQENWDTAQHLWSRAYAHNSDNLAVIYNLGVAAEMRESYGEALSFYRRARELSGIQKAFTREIAESMHSAEVLATFGSPGEIRKKPEEPQPPEPPKEAPKK